jgi:hypothetical protein
MPVESVPCDESIQAVIVGAAESQAAYMEGTLPAEALYDTWSDVAIHAQSQADQMIQYRDDRIQGVRIVDVTWVLENCVAVRQGDRARVTVRERWTYEANLSCTSGGESRSSWVDVFPAEELVLVRTADGWQISSWLTGPVEVSAKWVCP